MKEKISTKNSILATKPLTERKHSVLTDCMRQNQRGRSRAGTPNHPSAPPAPCQDINCNGGQWSGGV